VSDLATALRERIRRGGPVPLHEVMADVARAYYGRGQAFGREGDFNVAIKQMLEKPYLWFGLSGLLILFVLAVTSNNWSMRKLKYKRWKGLHKFVFLAFFLISIHILLIEKRSWLANKYTLYPMMFVLIVRFCHSVRHKLLHGIPAQKKV